MFAKLVNIDGDLMAVDVSFYIDHVGKNIVVAHVALQNPYLDIKGSGYDTVVAIVQGQMMDRYDELVADEDLERGDRLLKEWKESGCA